MHLGDDFNLEVGGAMMNGFLTRPCRRDDRGDDKD